MSDVRTIGRYRIQGTLGKGAMGTVYVAQDTELDRRVAVKVLDPQAASAEDGDFQERFLREARVAAGLNHPNLVAVYDVGEAAGLEGPFIVMEMVDGESLRDLLARTGAMPPARAASVIRQAAEGLHHAHGKGIVHRDVKPSNLLVTRDGTVKVADFGIARPIASEMTQTGQLLGTPHYMAPEQITGDPVDARTDVFGLGVVLYQLLTGEKPFAGDTLTAVSYRIVHTDPVPASAIRPSVPPAFDPVLAQAMARNPAERYQDALSLAEALRPLESAPTGAAGGPAAAQDMSGTLASPHPRPSRPPAKRWLLLGTAAAAVALLVATVALVTVLSTRGESPEAPDAQLPGAAPTEDAAPPEGEPPPSAEKPWPPAAAARPETQPASTAAPTGGSKAAAATVADPATVRFAFRHRQRDGSLTLSVDGSAVYSSGLQAEGAFSKEEIWGSFQMAPGGRSIHAVLTLEDSGGGRWEAELEVDPKPGTENALLIKYQKFIRRGELKMYWNTDRARRAVSR